MPILRTGRIAQGWNICPSPVANVDPETGRTYVVFEPRVKHASPQRTPSHTL
ncbi:hypothetical protein A8926_5669 [Saccharopolyspora spinosa]|uniref:Uncharacterized protein n=1 Tax=Saccharopolyspora spinosa TaxID=60894 RepID=A0A2N3Y442_SACSN|nr:hypothetical protein A8926_5669 [Saccharopolyspora spinosa]